MDWESWAKHVRYWVEKRGRWYGLGDGDGTPLVTLPEPADNDTPDQWMGAEDLSASFLARTEEGEVFYLTEKLIMDALKDFDPSGQLPPAEGEYTFLVAWAGPNGEIVRRGGVITHTDATDPSNDGLPFEAKVHALNAMDAWNTIPAVSWPASWWRTTPYERTKDEAEIPYSRPWRMSRVEMATRSTFVWKHGPAGFVIRRLAQESLDAVMRTQQDPDGTRWVDDPYHVVEVPEMDTTPTISLEARDGFLWDTVASQAKNAGVILGAHIWWPGDPPIRCWTPATSDMTPQQVDITPSQGQPHRTVGYHTFPHAMIVLTVKEV